MFIVMWALALGALVLSSLQLFGYRQAMLGRDVSARIQARWAARGGLEYLIAVMADHTAEPDPDDPYAMVRDMDAFFEGEYEVGGRVISSYDIRHDADGRQWAGPMDEHSKININAALTDPRLLNSLWDMTPDIVDALLDWLDEDDDERPLGAERYYYQSLSIPYEPRNGPMRNIGEMELVAGMWPEHLRGEDWDLNSRIDPNEDDGEQTWPPDEPDQKLDSGWAGLLTTYSVEANLGVSGLPLLDLAEADPAEIEERLGIEADQAEALSTFARQSDARIESLLTEQIARMHQPAEAARITRTRRAQPTSGMMLTAADESQSQQTKTPPPELDLETTELGDVFAEATIGASDRRGPGRMNINTVSEELLRQLLVDREHLINEIMYLRSVAGINSMADLIEIPAFQEDTETLEYLAQIMDTRSYVYTICSKGRSWPSGLEVEIIATVDRSTLPVRILEYREQ
jgi:hypothetical protein